MDGVEGLDNVQDISPALEATEDFLHCLDGIYDQSQHQNNSVDLRQLQDVSNGELEKLSSSNMWCLLAGEQSEFGPMSFAWADHQPPSAISTLGQGNGLRHGKKSRAQSTNDLASHSKECSYISNSVFKKGHHRSRSDVHYRPSTCTDNGLATVEASAPKNTDRNADKDMRRAVVVKQADVEQREGPGWARCHLQLTPCELRLYALDSSANHQLVTAYSLSHCQSVSSPAPDIHLSKGVQVQSTDERTLHALFFNSTHLQLRTENKWEAMEWKRLIWERVLATRPTNQKHQLNKVCEKNPPVAQFHKPLCLLSPSNRPTALPLFTQHSQDILKVGLLHLLIEQKHWRTFTFVLTQTVLQGFLTEGRGPISEPVFRYHLATCLNVELDSKNVHPKRCPAGAGNIFKAVFPRQVLWLQAESRIEAQSWVEILCKAVEVQRPSHRRKEEISKDATILKVVLHRSQEQRQRVDQQQQPVTSSFLSILTCLAVEKGLTAQSFKCAGCQGQVGLSGDKAKVCCYSGWYYCTSCHQDNTFIIPARLLHNWDTGKHKVSKQAKEFLEFVYEEPLLDVQNLNPFLYQHCEPLSTVLQLRQRLQSLRAYLFSCRAAVAEDLRRRIFPREYLLQHIHLYSIADLQQVIDGRLAPFLSKVIKFASSHVFSCSLCQEKGFICELCKNGQVIYPFQESATKRCKGCDAVFHAECHEKAQPCPRCVRREMHKRHSALRFNEDDDVPDCYQNT